MAHPSEDTLTTVFRDLLIEYDLNAEAFPILETPKGIKFDFYKNSVISPYSIYICLIILSTQ